MSERHSSGSRRGAQRDTVAVSRGLPRQRGGGQARGAQRRTVEVTPRIPSRLRGVLVAGVVTSVWNVLVVLLPLLLAALVVWWAAGASGAVSTLVRVAGAIWLAGHAVPVEITGIPVSVPPLLLTAVIAWRASRAGANTIRAIRGRDFPAVRAAVLSVALGYTAIGVLVTVVVNSEFIGVRVWQAALHTAAMAIIAGGLGALTESGGGKALWFRVPVWARRGVRAGALTSVAVWAAGALLLGVSLALRGETVSQMLGVYSGGAWPLLVLSLLYLPTAALWAGAYILGPGFAVGVGTEVSVVAVNLGDFPVLPQFPLFAAVPTAPLEWWGTALWGVPLALASLHGVILAQRCVDLRFPRLMYASLLSGVSAGLLTACAMWLAQGSLGSQRLAQLGPPVWQTAVTAAGLTAGVVLAAALVTRGLGARHSTAPR